MQYTVVQLILLTLLMTFWHAADDLDELRTEGADGILLDSSNSAKRCSLSISEIRHYCQQRTAINFTDLMAAFGTMPVKQLEK